MPERVNKGITGYKGKEGSSNKVEGKLDKTEARGIKRRRQRGIRVI